MMYCFVFKPKTTYEMRISDWSADVCSSDLEAARSGEAGRGFAVVAQEVKALAGQARAASKDFRALVIDRLKTGSDIADSLADDIEGSRLADRKSVGSGKGVAVQVDLAGHRLMKKKHVSTKPISAIHL